MERSGLARRQVIAGSLSAALAPTVGRAADGPSPIAWSERPAFSDGLLASNAMARRFVAPAAPAAWPSDAPLAGPRGAVSLSARRGKILLVALWADWCAPCLAEMPTLSHLNQTYGGRRFEILPISTGSHAIRTQADAQKRLAAVPGVQIETLADASPDGAGLMRRLAQSKPPIPAKPGETVTATALPCLLIVGPDGALRGRMLGGPGPGEPDLWTGAPARAFIDALARGAA